MKEKIIIDNRTQQSISNILIAAQKFLDSNKQKSSILSVGSKDVYCSVINNEQSKRLLFTYQKFLQEELF